MNSTRLVQAALLMHWQEMVDHIHGRYGNEAEIQTAQLYFGRRLSRNIPFQSYRLEVSGPRGEWETSYMLYPEDLQIKLPELHKDICSALGLYPEATKNTRFKSKRPYATASAPNAHDLARGTVAMERLRRQELPAIAYADDELTMVDTAITECAAALKLYSAMNDHRRKLEAEVHQLRKRLVNRYPLLGEKESPYLRCKEYQYLEVLDSLLYSEDAIRRMLQLLKQTREKVAASLDAQRTEAKKKEMEWLAAATA